MAAQVCGIGGCVVRPGRQPAVDRLTALRDALQHRGPDDSGIEILGNAGLVQTRLAIVDLSPRGHQPMRHPDGREWLVYNGEVYNHAVLRSRLGNSEFVGGSDTETLLHALHEWGPMDAARKLTGQFAYAYLDTRTNTLTLARDRFGIKPLYFARPAGGEEIWFASEPEALIAAGITPLPVDDAWLSITVGGYLGGRDTLLKDITRLPSGANTVIDLDTLSIGTTRWHDPTDEVDPDSSARLARLSRSQLTDELEHTLRTSVQSSLLADATVGTFCSGGLDSSLITAFATEIKPGMVAFGASFKGDGPDDEGIAAARVAKALNVDLELVDVTPERWLDGFVRGTIHHGSPLANASAVTVSELAARARDRGVKVVMTGEGADELFAGYGTIHALAVEQFLPRPQAFLHWLEPRLLGSRRRYLDPARFIQRARSVARALARGPSTHPNAWGGVLTPNTLDPSDEIARSAYAHHTGERQRLEATLLGRLDFSLCWLLNRMDKNVMQSSVEARVPFLEPAVVRLALNLPLEQRIGPWSKGILRDVARRLLPLRIAYRPKVYGLDFDAGSWIAQAARPDFLSQGLLRETVNVPPAEFDRVVDGAIEGMRLRLWSAEVWARATLAGHSAERIEQALWR